MKYRGFKYSIAIVLCLTTLFFTGKDIVAQQYNTIHWMQGIPQSTYSNPGLQTHANGYFSMPLASSIYFGAFHTGFQPSDLLRKGEGENSFYIDTDNMLSKLRDNNYLSINYEHEILAFGFRGGMGDSYFTFNITEKINTRFGYPKDLMYLLIKGNSYFMNDDVSADFSGIGFDAIHYREFSLGYNKQWTNELKMGMRTKFLFGMSNLEFEKTDISVYSDPQTYDMTTHANILINSSQPFLGIEVDDDDFKETDVDEKELDVEDYSGNIQNFGFAVDLGGVYDIGNFSLGLSVLDLGFIDWRTDLDNLEIEGDFDFEGVDIEVEDFLDDDNGNDEADTEHFVETLIDTIGESFNIKQTNDPYYTILPPKLLFSATYNITDIQKIGLMTEVEYYKESFYPSFTFAYSIQPIRAIGASLSYSVIHDNLTNLGFGLHLNLFPLQFYVVGNNFFPALQPHTLQNFTIQTGLNWVIGYKLDRTLPLYSW